MKYFPKDLKDEYNRFTKEYPDIDGLSPHPLINLSDAFRAYFTLAHFFTDDSGGDEAETMLVGIRSVDLLASALGRQQITFGGKQKYTDPVDICATLFYGITKNHSFSDGNKRTALLLLLYQLNLYGWLPAAPKEDFEKLVLAVAADTLDKTYPDIFQQVKNREDWKVRVISRCIRKMVRRKDNTYHVAPTMREFCAALETYGVDCTLDNGKMKFVYSPEAYGWKTLEPETKRFTVQFCGWTRVVGAGTAREILNKLDLYDQFPDYQSIFDGVEPLYNLVDDFKEPLKRLKDE